MLVTPSFMHLRIAFINQRFRNCSPTVDAGFVNLASGSSCGNGLQDEYSVLLSPVLQYLCDFSKQAFSMYDDLFRSVLVFAHCSSSLMSSRHSRYTEVPNKRPPTKIGVSHYPIPSHRLSLNTITNALTRALQSVNKRKNIQYCQLKFFQCSQHKFYSSVSWPFHYFVHPLHTYAYMHTLCIHREESEITLNKRAGYLSETSRNVHMSSIPKQMRDAEF
jgi:hypothetical protein